MSFADAFKAMSNAITQVAMGVGMDGSSGSQQTETDKGKGTRDPRDQRRYDAWERTDYVGNTGERQDNWPPNPELQEENARLMEEFHVYINTDGRYQMEDAYRYACEDLGYEPQEIHDKYKDTSEYLRSLPVPDGVDKMESSGAYHDVMMWEKAHDPAYLSSLDSEGLGQFMEKYQEWEKEHVIPPMNEGEEPTVVMGATVTEYREMDSAGRARLDAIAANCQVEFAKAFDSGFEDYQKDIEDSPTPQSDAPQDGFWSNLKNQVSTGMSMFRSMLESTAVGAWIVNAYDNVKEGAANLFDSAKDKANDLTSAYGTATEEAEGEKQSDTQTEDTKGKGDAGDGRGKDKYDPYDFQEYEGMGTNENQKVSEDVSMETT